MKQIETLTEAQKAQFPKFIEKWKAIGLCTDEADWQSFETAVAQCYQTAKLAPPKAIIHVQSPVVAVLAGPIAAYLIALFQQKSIVAPAVYSAVNSAADSSVAPAVYSAVALAVDSAVYSAVGSAVDSAVYSEVDSAVNSAVALAVDSAVHSAVDSAVHSAVDSKKQVKEITIILKQLWHNRFCGQFWPAWASFIDFLVDACGLDLGELDKIRHSYATTIRSANWWWPHKDFVIVCNRPRIISLDTSGRLHNSTGKAVEYRDGWGIYQWHGVAVTKQIIEHPETITIKQIEEEVNAEIRRIMIERYGESRYLMNSNAKVVHTDDYGTLYRKDILNDEPIVMVKVVNSTREPDGSFKDYFLRVPPATKTARAGVAWTFNISPKEYAPLIET